MKRTEELTANIRRETIPGLTTEEYLGLLAGKDVEVKSKEAREYLAFHGFAQKKGE